MEGAAALEKYGNRVNSPLWRKQRKGATIICDLLSTNMLYKISYMPYKISYMPYKISYIIYSILNILYII